MKWNDKYTKYIWITLLVVLGSYIYIEDKEFNQEIDENKFRTICKAYKYESTRSHTSIYYYYYYRGRKFEGIGSLKTPWGISNEDYINRFFIVEISSKKPSQNRFFQNKEVRNLSDIKKVGFKDAVLKPTLRD